ncbi:MAG TPA: hypothetical protein DCP32_03575 [Anaerolineaceae bacterium]|nr:MAG: hypothetical protein A2X24_09310 [Chloroflexi bacterium GWB2_54_36]HAL15849.1 hypothetical protein [Anaerolineaceae bacterium]HBA91566.1 hypothetical protein [Anaerolineaceae bacterium]
MQRYFAFLRAVNVGGHTVKMEVLRLQFEALGFSKVETFIASGNVIFESNLTDTLALESKIEAGLNSGLGFSISVFLRTFNELTAIAACQPFSVQDFAHATAFNVAFLVQAPENAWVERLNLLQNEIDQFKVIGREVYWLCQVRQSESKFSNGVLEKTLHQPTTIRQMTTIQRMVEKYK